MKSEGRCVCVITAFLGGTINREQMANTLKLINQNNN